MVNAMPFDKVVRKLKSVAASTGKHIVSRAGASSLGLRMLESHMGAGVIFMLHRVVEPGRPILYPQYMIDTRVLDETLRVTRQMGWEIVSIDEVHRRLTERDFRGRRFACFTSDDGYSDNLTVALPVFRRHGAPFAVYPCTAVLDRSLDYWWGALEEVILRNDRIELPQEVPDCAGVLSCRTVEEKSRTLGILDAMCHLHGSAIMQRMWDRYRIDPRALLDRDALTIEQARQLARDPLVTIGAHSISHRRLSELSENECRQELAESRATLENWLGIPVQHLAYPFGAADSCGKREFTLASELGYKTAVTTRRGNLFAAHGDHLTALPRRGAATSPMQLRNALNGLESYFARTSPVQVV